MSAPSGATDTMVPQPVGAGQGHAAPAGGRSATDSPRRARGLSQLRAAAPRRRAQAASTLPGLAPVSRPSLTTGVPFTNTSPTPAWGPQRLIERGQVADRVRIEDDNV